MLGLMEMNVNIIVYLYININTLYFPENKLLLYENNYILWLEVFGRDWLYIWGDLNIPTSVAPTSPYKQHGF